MTHDVARGRRVAHQAEAGIADVTQLVLLALQTPANVVTEVAHSDVLLE